MDKVGEQDGETLRGLKRRMSVGMIRVVMDGIRILGGERRNL